ncbi:MAG: hypothetical protein IPL36_13425 [Nigerium sp.]|nr:hypothetical protein [Nigerium sp.]
MDDWTYPYPDADAPDSQPALLDQDWRVRETRRVRAQQVEAAGVAELELMDVPHDVRDPRLDTSVPLPFASPSGAAPTF